MSEGGKEKGREGERERKEGGREGRKKGRESGNHLYFSPRINHFKPNILIAYLFP